MEVIFSGPDIQEKLQHILEQIDLCWNRYGAWLDYRSAMRLTFNPSDETETEGSKTLRLALLPGLCCQAAGGEFAWAERLAAAWLLLYNSAHILDKVEDNDPLEPGWSFTEPGIAINAASGMIFSAYLCLAGLFEGEVSRVAAQETLEDYSKTLLEMGSGQHRDLCVGNPDLEGWMRVAGAKSGGFFALACRSGARLATGDHGRILNFSEFGYHLGVLLQLLDDVGDFKVLRQGENSVQVEALNRSIVVAYAQEVLPEEAKRQLRESLARLGETPLAAQELVDLLDGCGAGLYLATEIERQRLSGLNALAAAQPQGDAGGKLALLLTGLLED